MSVLPPLTRTASDAERFARVVHGGQVDKAGRPYVEHLERVVGWLKWKLPIYHSLSDPDAYRKMDDVVQIAWLHDVIEDTRYTAENLLDEGFHRDVVTAVGMLSKPEGCLRYRDWIEHIIQLGNLPVLIVKLADMEDNADPERLALLPAATRERLERKYAEPLKMLRTAVEREADGTR